VIRFLWSMYGLKGENHQPADIAVSEAGAGRCVRRAFAAMRSHIA
jgi:hypothetical protein